MPDHADRAPLSERARMLSLGMRTTVAFGTVMLLVAFAGAKGWLPRATGTTALYLFGASIVIVFYLGAKTRAWALADRERESGQAMIVVIAAQLARQDIPTLERIASRGGPAAEAARIVLAGRRKSESSDGQAPPA